MKILKLLMRLKDPTTNKKRLFIGSRNLYDLLDSNVSYKTFLETNILWSRLRENIDYHYYKRLDTYNLSISAVQAILILENTEKSWQLFNEMTDLINAGFTPFLNGASNASN